MKPEHKNRKYTVDDYNPLWPEQYKTESQNIHAIFGNAVLDIQHIGSTAVPELAGKPTIDILVIVKDISEADKHNNEFESLGYKVLGEYVMKGARLFAKEEDNSRVYNVHVFEQNHPHVQEMLKVRGYLRNHPDEVKEYGRIKKELYRKYPDDYATCRKLKDEYMAELINKALSRS